MKIKTLEERLLPAKFKIQNQIVQRKVELRQLVAEQRATIYDAFTGESYDLLYDQYVKAYIKDNDYFSISLELNELDFVEKTEKVVVKSQRRSRQIVK